MVIALDKHKKPLGFCTERRARILMEKRRACIYRYFPFTIILKDIDVRDIGSLPTYRIKIDPGSKYTGIAVIQNDNNTVILYAQIEHRGGEIKSALQTRRGCRRNRRSRETRYRRCKFSKGGQFTSSRPKGWLPPSIKSIGDNIIHWVALLSKLVNITDCSFEAVRFDTQLMDNPEIEGEGYQHGTLEGTEIREYLLDKYGHVCRYCRGVSGDPILEWEHIVPKSKGGSDSVKNATLSCSRCNRDKGDSLLDDWEAKEALILNDPGTSEKRKALAGARIEGIQYVRSGKPNKVSNRYCAWANASRRCIEKGLFAMFENVKCASGGRTKYNRTRLGLPKDHHYDALCVGAVPEDGYRDRTGQYCLKIKATGHGTRFRGKINKCKSETKRS